ncbi:nitrogen regulation protein NR(II) [Craterilacuibacter sinensis]|uniref:Sensory histidine kinase/phosphatase NtrB n=1 Tax=Craterilacuibacter sinensis TaxID=2686017 RepID=A0A845C0E0_9NEIS|nr:nitrogen regulation protein NR(II) [Craterilacuibacter sinensis]MXR38183.1 PAS domain-containing protein [Craterilacuibacter sinensis]
MPDSNFSGLDLLETPVLIIEHDSDIVYANQACESLFAVGKRELTRHSLFDLIQDSRALRHAVQSALQCQASFIEHDLPLLLRNEQSLHVGLTVTPIDNEGRRALVELRPIDQQRKIANEERLLLQQRANRELIRNLAHEIKNPLGGIRGAAQLLEHEIADRPELLEYTGVIREEALRLQSLVDRMLAPHKRQLASEVNIHEVLERVRSIVLAEFGTGLSIRRDYDVSLPFLIADKAQLIQVVLNITRNAAQALKGTGEIILKTRISRQVTLARKRHNLALKLQIIDNGPGIPDEIQDHVFYPLVTGRAEGTGLGLTLAQTFIQQHGGTIEFDSYPGYTCFSIALPFGNECAITEKQ